MLIASCIALGLGMLWALRGPALRHVDVPVRGLDPRLHGLTIVQISDLHVGSIIRRRYVRHVAEKALAAKPDLFVLTGDLVDGTVSRLGPEIAPLLALPQQAPTFFCTGNHEYYSGVRDWLAHFAQAGVAVLENRHALVEHRGARVLIGGVNDPMGRRLGGGPDADAAAARETPAALRILLAHNPRLAPAGARAGFHLQLSGHTHGGQFFPWTLVVQRVHAPHITGVSREGQMTVYVSAGTGSWGPPVRFGTRTEIGLLRLVPESATPARPG